MNFLKPAKYITELTQDKITQKYPRWRLRIFLVAYIGYFTYYFDRSSFDVSKQYITTLSRVELGFIGAGLAVAYDLSKFLMGNLSDRSNAKVFLAIGLFLTGLINLIIPSMLSLGVLAMFIVMFINGWVQGMGWPACARIMTHWFCTNELGTKMGIWNTAHNVGAGFLAIAVVPVGLYLFNGDWHGLFYVAGTMCIFIAILVLIFGVDTTQSIGLPAIEVYKGYISAEAYQEHEYSAKEIFFKYVLNNKWIWTIAIS